MNLENWEKFTHVFFGHYAVGQRRVGVKKHKSMHIDAQRRGQGMALFAECGVCPSLLCSGERELVKKLRNWDVF